MKLELRAEGDRNGANRSDCVLKTGTQEGLVTETMKGEAPSIGVSHQSMPRTEAVP